MQSAVQLASLQHACVPQNGKPCSLNPSLNLGTGLAVQTFKLCWRVGHGRWPGGCLGGCPGPVWAGCQPTTQSTCRAPLRQQLRSLGNYCICPLRSPSTKSTNCTFVFWIAHKIGLVPLVAPATSVGVGWHHPQVGNCCSLNPRLNPISRIAV